MNRGLRFSLAPWLSVAAPGLAADPTAHTFHVTLPPPPHAETLQPGSPFGIHTAFQPATPDLDARLETMQQAGIKWGRQEFTS